MEKGNYRDSVTLMKVSNEVSKLKGVSQAAVLMATPLNKRFLADAGFKGSEVEKAGPDDLIIAIEAASEEVLESSVSRVEEMLSSRESVEAEEIRPSPILLKRERTLGRARREKEFSAAGPFFFSIPLGTNSGMRLPRP